VNLIQLSRNTVRRQMPGNTVTKFRGFINGWEFLDQRNDCHSQEGLLWALVTAKVRVGVQCLNVTDEVDTHTGVWAFSKTYQWPQRLTCNSHTRTVLRWATSPRHFYLSGHVQCTMTRAEWGGFLYTNYMPIYNHPCDTENEFTAWIPVIIAILCSSLFLLLSHSS
jgi:hypothetical protein